jgi:large subunit ribosomal protein L35
VYRVSDLTALPLSLGRSAPIKREQAYLVRRFDGMGRVCTLEEVMPKNKTHSGTKKRVKISSNGKLLRRRAFSSHLLTKKSSKRKRRMRKDQLFASSDINRLRNLLGI